MKKLLTFLLTALLAFGVGWAAEVTFNATTDKGSVTSNGTTQNGDHVTKSGITVTSSNGVMGNGTDYRVYQNGTLTVTTSSGNITKIEMTFTASGTSNYGPSKLSATDYSYSGKVGTWQGTAASSVTFSASAQARITQIVVTTSGGTMQTCETPTISLASGTYSGTQTVTITSATSGATIYYTTDGNNPTTSSSNISNGGSVNISSTCTLKAIAAKSGMNNSAVATAEYVITTGGDNIYRKVISLDDLVAGKKYIIVYEDDNRFLGSINTSGSTHYGNQVQGPTISNSKVNIAGYDDIKELTLYGTSAGWSFQSDEGYLKWSSGNSLDKESSITNNSKWTVDGSQSSGFSLTNVAGTTRVLKYNTGSPRFACYESGQKPAYLYVQDSNDPTLTLSPASQALVDIPYNAASGATTTGTITVTGAHLTGNVTVSISGADFSVSPTTLTPDADGSLNATVTVTYSGTSTTEVTGTVTVTCGDLTETATVTAKKETPPAPSLTVNPSTLNINDSGTGNTFTVEGSNLGTDNVGLTQTGSYFTPMLSATTGTTYDGGTYWGFTPANGSVNGTVAMSYTGRELSANETVTLGNNSGASATVTVNYRADLYIVGDFGSGWDFSTGTPMTYNATDNTYTTSVTVDAGNLVLFARKLGESNPWNSRLVFGPNSGGDWWVNGNNATGTIDLNDDDPIYFVNGGTYIITINASTGALTVSKQEIGADDFILVESDNDINTTSDYILVYTGGVVGDDAMSTSISGTNTGYYNSTSQNFSRVEKVISLEEGHSVNILVLEDAGDGKYYIKGGDYYIGTSGNNMARSTTQVTTNAYKWSISINDNLAVITNASTSRVLAYNTQNPRFTTYASITSGSDQQYASLYKRGDVSSVPAPQITPAGGTSNKRFESFDVTITAADETYTIYYTTDGTNPTINSTEYTAPFELPYGSAPTTVKAIAVDGQGNVSRVTTVVYYWNRATVSISPASQRVTGDVNVTITPTPSDATVTYKVNGGAEQTYSAPFTVQVNEENHSVTVVAIARKGESVATDTVTYTFKSDKVYSIEEFLALENGEEVTFENPVIVLFDYSQHSGSGQEYIWVKDRTGYTQFFLTPAIDHSSWVPKYENGDVIPEGFKVKKNYFSNGSYIQGYCSGDSINSFADSDSKALADPEQVTLTQLLNSIPTGSGQYSEYNNRYLYMNKVKILSKNGLNFTFAADENGTIVNGDTDVVGYNKYNSPAWKNKQGETVGVTIPDVDDTYYNVKFIFQKWQGGYEIMPIEFTLWEDNKVRLEDLVETGVKDQEYTITNPLIVAKVTWDDVKGKFAIFAKDDEAYAHKRNPGNLKSYLIEYENGSFVNSLPQEKYDQSNWVEILIPDTISTTAFTNKTASNDYNTTLDELQRTYEGKILAGGTINGTYIDDFNPTIEMTHAPAKPTSASTYDPNIYCTANFLISNLGDNGATSGRTDEYGGQYFMMDAKPHEFCKVVWAYFEGTDDYFVAPAREGDDINGLDFKGGFLTDMSLCEEQNVTSESHAKNLFKASDDESYGNEEALYSFKAIVRKNSKSPYWQSTGGNGAPRRILPKDDGARETTPAYIVYPLSSGGSDNTEIVTAVEDVNGKKMVDSVRYYNLMGQESKSPFEGINIVVTRYTDGSSSTAKILR